MSRQNNVIITDSAEGPDWVKVSSPTGERLVESDDVEGVRAAIDDLAGDYGNE